MKKIVSNIVIEYNNLENPNLQVANTDGHE